jgi:hypothetical protein
MRWAGNVTHIVAMRNACSILVGNPEGTDHREEQGIDRRIILKWILGK